MCETGTSNETTAERKRRAGKILRCLDREYPLAECALDYQNAWELLVATILSAQCTDSRVNMVTPELFRAYPTVQDMAAAPLEGIEELVHSTGFYRNKAKSIKSAAQRVVSDYGGAVPSRMEQLLTLPGVARKTANVVTGTWFGKATGVVVDTHVQRVSRRLGLAEGKNPRQIERALMELLPKARWVKYSHQIIEHGRGVCKARQPRCQACELAKHCPSVKD